MMQASEVTSDVASSAADVPGGEMAMGCRAGFESHGEGAKGTRRGMMHTSFSPLTALAF